MKKITYDWKDGWQPPGIDPQVAGLELERIRNKRGELTAVAVLEESRRPRAPLHGAFEWDDTLAAEKYREKQARDVVAAVVIRKVGRENVPPIRAFVNLRPEEEERQYIPSLDAREDPVLRQQMLDRGLAEFLIAKRKYGDLTEFAGVVRAIDEAQEQLKVAA